VRAIEINDTKTWEASCKNIEIILKIIAIDIIFTVYIGNSPSRGGSMHGVSRLHQPRESYNIVLSIKCFHLPVVWPTPLTPIH